MEVRAVVDALGLALLGDCIRPEPILVDGEPVYPGAYGKYAANCKACAGFEPVAPGAARVCGNCIHWDCPALEDAEYLDEYIE